MKVDTLVSTLSGHLKMGTKDAPIAADVTAKITVADDGGIDRVWDPGLLSRGALLHGKTTIYGAEKTAFAVVDDFQTKGDTSLTLKEAPVGWTVGDTIVIAGTRLDALSNSWSSKIYYDAAFGKPTTDHVLGLFTAWDKPIPRAAMMPAQLIANVLDELTDVFGPKVRANLIDDHAQNWTLEPHIWGSYSMNDENDAGVGELLRPFEGRMFFADEALGGGDAQSTVHGAAFSAIRAVDHLLQG